MHNVQVVNELVKNYFGTEMLKRDQDGAKKIASVQGRN